MRSFLHAIVGLVACVLVASSVSAQGQATPRVGQWSLGTGSTPGKGPASPVTVSPALDFAANVPGVVSGGLVTQIRNTTRQAVTVTAIDTRGQDAAAFSVSFGPTLPFVLAPGASEPVTVTFLAPVKGGYLAELDVRTAQAPQTPATARLFGAGIGPVTQEYLINAGGPEYTDSIGRIWNADFGYDGGYVYFPFAGPVAGTTDPLPFIAQRQGGFAYELPVLTPGVYRVLLHFAELEAPAPGINVVDVFAEGVVALDDLDVTGEAGFKTALKKKIEVNVQDGALSLDLLPVAGEASLAGLEVNAVPFLDASPTQVAFGAVSSGGSSQLVVTLTNIGADTLSFGSIELNQGAAGTAESMTLDFDGGTYVGAFFDQLWPVSTVLAPGASTPLQITFAPSSQQYDDVVVELNGNFGTLQLPVSGLGGHVGDPYLHVVIDAEPVTVDYDGDGFEDVVLDGSQSHTHEPGMSLVGYLWEEGTTTLGTNPVEVVSFPVGTHAVDLTISDDDVPAKSLQGSAQLEVVALDDIPGVLVRYFDATPGSASDLLFSVPAGADYAEILGDLRVDGNESIGASPFSNDVLVTMSAEVTVPAGVYDFQVTGGSQRVLFLEGLQLVGPVPVPAGTYGLEARFAVDNASQVPLEVLVSQDGGPFGTFDPTWLSHDQTGLLPTINSMPTIGTSLGGNTIQIDGIGFFPTDQVVVEWGATELSGASLDAVAADSISFLSPPGTGTIAVQVRTPQGTSNSRPFSYNISGPVPIDFDVVNTISMTSPSTGAWGPDGRFWVGRLDGKVTAIEFDDSYGVLSQTTYDGVSTTDEDTILGLAFDPHDTTPRVYVAHSETFAWGGTTITGPAPFIGKVSLLEGPTYDAATLTPVVTGLPSSNHDHLINGIEFDNNGDLLICVGGNTNAGVKHPNSGDLVESPLSAAILKAETSRPDFDGAITHVLSADGVTPTDDQRDGEICDVAGGHVTVQAHGVRNAYDIAYTTSGRLYAADNGPNNGFGAASTGPSSETSDPGDLDELLLIEYGNYYGSANRSRGRTDPRQDIYRGTSEPDIPGVFTQALATLPSSTDGLVEYRAQTFQGQMRGDLLAQKWGGFLKRLELSDDGRSVVAQSDITTFTGALDVEVGPGGAILAMSDGSNNLKVLVPDDLSATGLVVQDVTPWRAPATGGQLFVLGGVGFGNIANTTVTFDGIAAGLTSVTPTRIVGTVPAHPSAPYAPVDITVTVGGIQQHSLVDGFKYLPPPGTEIGFWEDLPTAPASLGEVAAAEVDGILYLMGEGSSSTFRYDILNATWLSNAATRPFPGHHQSVEVIGGKLYVIGGLVFGAEGKVQIYDPGTDSWSTGSPMPWAGGSVSTAAIGGKIYAAGGIVGSTTVSNHAVYDPLLDSWTALAPMPAGRNHAAAATDGTLFYVFGGRDGGNFVTNGYDDLQVYDPGTDTWAWSGDGVSGLAPLPQYRGGMGRAVWYRSEFYVFGGETQSGPGAVAGNVYDRVDVYDPATNTWRPEAPMPTPRHGVYPVLFQSRMFLAGGGTVAGFSTSDVFDVFTRQ